MCFGLDSWVSILDSVVYSIFFTKINTFHGALHVYTHNSHMTFLSKFILSVTGDQYKKHAKKTIRRFKFKKNILVILEMLERKSMIYCVMQVHNWHCMIIVWKQFLVVFLKMLQCVLSNSQWQKFGWLPCPARRAKQLSTHAHCLY